MIPYLLLPLLVILLGIFILIEKKLPNRGTVFILSNNSATILGSILIIIGIIIIIELYKSKK